MKESDDVLRIRLDRLMQVLNRLPTILKEFMISKTGVRSGGREYLMAFAILERIHYSTKACAPLAEELTYNHHAALALSHLFRSTIYEIITAHWLFEQDFAERMNRLNSEYIIRNDKRIRAFDFTTEESMQQTYTGWAGITPDNFEVVEKADKKTELKINPSIKPIQFTAIYDHLKGQVQDIDQLSMSYNTLSQQAHITEFSREIIYHRSESLIKLFDLNCRPIIAASLMLVNKIGNAPETVHALESLSNEFYPASAP